MPPARKDSMDEHDLSHPSTSRSFSPALVPPVKRARTTGAGAAPSSRRQSTGGRQARMEDFIDEKDLQDRLLVIAMETADEIMQEDEENGMEKLEIDSEVISTAASIVWSALAEDWATDLVAFSKHAGRETIKEEDVKLMMRRNPEMLAEILEECGDGEGSIPGTAKRKSNGGLQLGRPQKGRKDKRAVIFDDVTTPMGATSMDSVVPETPNGIIPLAHSTPMNSRSVSMLMGKRGNTDFPFPSPIREDEECEEGGKTGGRRVNRSIMNDLSDTRKDGEEERLGGVDTQEMDEDFVPLVMDVRHPREQEIERRRLRKSQEEEEEEHREFAQILVARSQRKEEDFFEKSDVEEEKKGDDYDSFDDEILLVDKDNGVGRMDDEVSTRMSESAALREMLDEGEEEKERTLTRKDDSFDDDFIEIVDKKKESKGTSRSPAGSIPSTSTTPIPPSGRAAPSPVPTRAAPAVSAISQRSSQDSFYRDEILDDPPPKVAAVVAPPVQTAKARPSPTAIAVVKPARNDDHDSFDDDDDDFVSTPNRSKENQSKPSPMITIANRWSTVEVEEVISPAATQKQKNGVTRGVFAEDIFGLSNLPGPSKPSPINKPSPTQKPSPAARPSPTVKQSPVVGSRPSPAASSLQKVSPTVAGKPAMPTSTVKNTQKKDGKAPTADFSSFTFFDSLGNPSVKREDSDFLDTSNGQTSSTKGTPRGRGGWRGRGRGFPRKVDPNSKVNRMIREMSTPVRLSPRPPSRLNEVVGSFEDDDFDVSAFD